MGKLSATRVATIREPGRYHDGDGLMLIVGATGRSWALRVKEPGPAGRRRDIGLGSLKDVGLADARKRAGVIRRQVKAGEPVSKPWERDRDPVPSFRDAAKRLHGELKRGWANGKHREQWIGTLEAFAFKAIGALPVDQIDAGAIRDVLLPIWLEKPETARRVRQRIGAVLDWAHAHGYRPTEAPMRAVNRTLPRQPARDGHFAALPFRDVPAFVARLREAESISRWALELLILTTARSGEIRGARWVEIDESAKVWTIPAERTKMRRPHRIPLSAPALRLLERVRPFASGELIFPGRDGRRPLSDMALTKLLRDLAVPATAHGFRSSFRDWAAERSGVPGEVAEAALAHVVSNRVEAAYRRTDFFEQRVKLMADWGRFVDQPEGGAVLSFPGGRRAGGDR